MSASLASLINSGTKLWLDSIDPELIDENLAFGATGATSNPIIIADLIKSGRFDDRIVSLIASGVDDNEIAWNMTDYLVTEAEEKFRAVWERTGGNDGYVSFEVDPLIEEPDAKIPHQHRVEMYVQLAKKWSRGHANRMIKVPATPAGLDALERIAAAGIPLNVTLIFTVDQCVKARDAIWNGSRQLADKSHFKSAYSIFVSRIDVYTDSHCSKLSAAAQGLVGIVNAQRIWKQNQEFWSGKDCPLQQEIIFASTGTKKPEDPPWKYVAALAGSDIQTNPPKINQAVADSGLVFPGKVAELPDKAILSDIDAHVDFDHMHDTLMSEGIAKFAQPQKELLALIRQKRRSLANV